MRSAAIRLISRKIWCSPRGSRVIYSCQVSVRVGRHGCLQARKARSRSACEVASGRFFRITLLTR
jgi:hypothetical protein